MKDNKRLCRLIIYDGFNYVKQAFVPHKKFETILRNLKSGIEQFKLRAYFCILKCSVKLIGKQ